MALTPKLPDYSLNNPDTLTKYKQVAQISQKVLETVSGMNSSLRSGGVGSFRTVADGVMPRMV
jgi:hypothetical protein